MDICSICKKNSNSILYKCNNCSTLFHQKCIKKWLKMNCEYDMIYYCKNCSFLGFNDEDLSYELFLKDIENKEVNNERQCCCKIC